MTSVLRAMTISSSDSSGGAGIQADLNTFAAHSVYGTSALTAVVSQNNRGVTNVVELPASLTDTQIDAIVSDIGTDAVKTGTLPSSTIIETLTEKAREYNPHVLVVDPAMVAEGEVRLIQDNALDALRTALIPMARVVTPNAPDAPVLLSSEAKTQMDARDAARDIVAMGAGAAVVTGGHLGRPSTNILFDGTEFRAFTAQGISSTGIHGAGCTLASAIATGLTRGIPLRDALSRTKKYVTVTIRHAFPMGHGHGPLNHFYRLLKSPLPSFLGR